MIRVVHILFLCQRYWLQTSKYTKFATAVYLLEWPAEGSHGTGTPSSSVAGIKFVTEPLGFSSTIRHTRLRGHNQ
eukprot:4746789-Amphidinium_carterae.1